MKLDAKRPILVVAGGTGGHVFPALAVAQALRDKGYTVAWLGTQQGLENQIIPPTGIPFYTLPSRGLRKKNFIHQLKAVGGLFQSIWRSFLLLQRLKPCLVIGFGGYASVPGGIASKVLGIPLVIHEQNALPGLANRFLCRLANSVLTAFPQVLEHCKNTHFTGNPIRPEFTQIRLQPKEQRLPQTTLKILVLGGSLGAQALNEAVPLALKQLPASEKLEVRHQCGKDHRVATETHYSGVPFPYTIHAFLNPVAESLAWADLVICRAGAMTIAELSYLSKPSILVPYPLAVDDHQTYNARYLSDKGAAILIPQKALTPEKLSQVLLEFCQSPDKCYTMARKAGALANPQATTKVVLECLRLIA